MIGHFLQFFVVLFQIIGRYCKVKVGSDIAQCLPRSVYKAKQIMGEIRFKCYVVCRKCFSFMECVEGSGARRRSAHCTFKQYPSHPHLRMRSPCGTLLLKNVELATKKPISIRF